MIKSTANTFIILICCLFVISCNSTGSSDLTLEDIIPNSTWYFNSDGQNVYTKVVFNNLNTTSDFASFIPFPCDTNSATSNQTAKYDIISDSQINFTLDQIYETVFEVFDYSKTKIKASVSGEHMEETLLITLRSKCADLR